jgi:hypothetical protein
MSVRISTNGGNTSGQTNCNASETFATVNHIFQTTIAGAANRRKGTLSTRSCVTAGPQPQTDEQPTGCKGNSVIATQAAISRKL